MTNRRSKVSDYEVLAEMLCELTRQCGIKEDFFARSFSLSPTEVRLLKLFAFSDIYTVKEIREKLKITPGRVTHIISTLEEKKLIRRLKDTTDRRSIKISLTPGASPFIRNLRRNYSRLHKDILKSISKEEMKKIYFSLGVLNDVFRKWI
ncbi:MAG: MarR family transcriptional regulator [Ignavibacteriaceae bacterium]|nr:MarR family transcriptional regulator [Ignavibacteriaceae bacterium]